jgi:cell wall-associated NlpC family hydrolase
MSEYNLKTGDLLLFDGGDKGLFGYVSSLIKFFTRSNISHIGMVLKDPSFIHPSLKGYYVWESSWEGEPDPQDGHVKFGVQITPFDEIIRNYKKTNSLIYVRRSLYSKDPFTYDALYKIHETVYDKAYDIVPGDWLAALWRKDSHPQKTDRFWCSALVGYIYTQCGILKPDTDWSILRPSDFTAKANDLPFTGTATLGKETQIKT